MRAAPFAPPPRSNLTPHSSRLAFGRDARHRFGGAPDGKQQLQSPVSQIAPVRDEIFHVREVDRDRLRASVACADGLEMLRRRNLNQEQLFHGNTERSRQAQFLCFSNSSVAKRFLERQMNAARMADHILAQFLRQSTRKSTTRSRLIALPILTTEGTEFYRRRSPLRAGATPHPGVTPGVAKGAAEGGRSCPLCVRRLSVGRGEERRS